MRRWLDPIGLDAVGVISVVIAAGVMVLGSCSVVAPLRHRWIGPRALPLDSQKLLAVDCGVDCVAYRYPLAAATLGGDGIIRFPVRIEVEVSRPWPEEQFHSRYGPGTVIRRDLSLGIAVWRKTPKTGWILIDCQRQRVAPWASSPTPPASVQHRARQGQVVFTEQTWQPAFTDGQPSPHRITGGAHQIDQYFCS